ncbi:FadR/GntR family transcriptional regulator [Kocuria palustris]|uniref:FadR/GntR family transcriptional regulator n=1 Tax=Kocuria palustris TaxID=71999 RepID=UPI00164358D9|nr:GntR family transcriptional regulator [Kocuria palustris]
MLTTLMTPLSAPSRAEQVQRRLRGAIRSGVLEADTQLPSEKELSERLGVSPTTVREALETLRGDGLITTRRGRTGGSFVNRPAPQQPRWISTFGTQELAELAEHESAIAGRCAILAARRAARREREGLRSAVEAFRAAESHGARARCESDLLIRLAGAAQSARLTREQIGLQDPWASVVAEVYTEQICAERAAQRWQSLTDLLAPAAAEDCRREIEDHIEELLEAALRLKLESAAGSRGGADAAGPHP